MLKKAGAAFLHMNAKYDKLRHSSGNKRISSNDTDTVQRQWQRTMSNNTMCNFFPRSLCTQLNNSFDCVFHRFILIFVWSHNEFWMVVEAMMRLNSKLLFFHAHQPFPRHWFSIDSIGIEHLLLYYQAFAHHSSVYRILHCVYLHFHRFLQFFCSLELS